MTNALVAMAMVVRALFFAPLLVIDREPIGRCDLVSYSPRFGLMIPRCRTSGYEWSGTVVDVGPS